MKVTVNRKKAVEHDIFSQGNLVVHITSNLVLLVILSFKEEFKGEFKGIVIDGGSYKNRDDKLLKIGSEATYYRQGFKQFYGIITLQIED